MNKLIKFEFRKIFQQKSFYICMGVAVLLTLLNVVLMKNIASASEEIAFSTMSMTSKAISGSNFIMVMGIFIALYACDDYSNNTMKNIVSKGYKKEHIFLSKYIVSLVVSLVSALVMILLTYVLTISANTGTETFKDILPILIGQLFILIAYHALYFSAGMIIGKVGRSVAFNLVGPTLVVTVLTLITAILKIESLSISDYWIDSAFSNLVIGVSNDVIVKAIVMGIVYSIIFVVAGVLINKKKEA